jgi:hypothetical protein
MKLDVNWSAKTEKGKLEDCAQWSKGVIAKKTLYLGIIGQTYLFTRVNIVRLLIVWFESDCILLSNPKSHFWQIHFDDSQITLSMNSFWRFPNRTFDEFILTIPKSHFWWTHFDGSKITLLVDFCGLWWFPNHTFSHNWRSTKSMIWIVSERNLRKRTGGKKESLIGRHMASSFNICGLLWYANDREIWIKFFESLLSGNRTAIYRMTECCWWLRELEIWLQWCQWKVQRDDHKKNWEGSKFTKRSRLSIYFTFLESNPPVLQIVDSRRNSPHFDFRILFL